jgi:hypothetical protein
MEGAAASESVMAGLVSAIHVFVELKCKPSAAKP